MGKSHQHCFLNGANQVLILSPTTATTTTTTTTTIILLQQQILINLDEDKTRRLKQ